MTTGRPTVVTPETIGKLEEVFAIGGTDEEACFYADIGTSTLYNYQQANPLFVERKEALKQRPFLKARQTFVKALEDPHYAVEYLRRKKKAEFSDRIEMTGAEGRDLTTGISDEDRELAKAIINARNNPRSNLKS